MTPTDALYEEILKEADDLRVKVAQLRAALELFLATVNPPYPQSMALWNEHLKAATENARRALRDEP